MEEQRWKQPRECVAAMMQPANRKLLRAGLLRGGIPFVLMLVMALLMLLGGEQSDAGSMFAGAIVVASVAGFTVLYDIESWSLLKQSVVHFVCMAVTLLPVFFLAGWFPVEGPRDVFFILGLFLASGVVFWVVGYLVSGKLLNKSKKNVPDVVQ